MVNEGETKVFHLPFPRYSQNLADIALSLLAAFKAIPNEKMVNEFQIINVKKYLDTSPSGEWAPTVQDFPENVTGKYSYYVFKWFESKLVMSL